MFQFLTYSLLLVNYLTFPVSGNEEDRSVEVNNTKPTRPPFPQANGLYKFVQTCENFCDDQFPPGFLGETATNGVIACHKGCYAFELFKVIGPKKRFLMIEKICVANCVKDFGDETFDGKFCGMGCNKMGLLYGNRVKQLRSELIARLRKLGQLKPADREEVQPESLQKYTDQAEKYMNERDNLAAEELAVHVIVEHEKLHAVRFLKTGRLKTKIFHVGRLSDNPELQRYLKTERRKIFEEEESQKREIDEKNEIEQIIGIESKGSGSVVMKLPPFPRRVDTECLIFQIPIYVLTVFVFIIIAIGLWATYGDPADCLFCLGRKFWDKLEYMDTYSTDFDEDEIITHERLVTKANKDMFVIEEDYQDYTNPPPDKDAPPPYVEASVTKIDLIF